MLLKPMAENLLTMKPTKENTGKEFKNQLFFPIGGMIEKLEDMEQSGVNAGNKVIFLKLDCHGLDYLSEEKYDLTFDLFRNGNIILYHTKNALIKNLGADTMEITILEDVKKIS